MTETKPPETHAYLLDRPLFAHLATVRPDGSPQSSVMWFAWDGEFVKFTHTKLRQKFRNLGENGQVALSIVDPDDGYRFLEVRGSVESVEDDETGAFYDFLAERYGTLGRVRDPKVRVVVKVRPEKFVAVEGGHVVGSDPSVY
ncbi:PPOX class F420-dependent oxidoreductase [Tenggerimyces flavus]|uniref:PPOX class F420-dependent oxidoreductase n=1 Tax=Tenggerimyces flavus TaxID=1708749 RepID=A0ABV7YJD3_9ACTN|nr:PPOX class F420-dependent oxidoreductase [Tenggerimyces flavus]MBM7787285.1 PPOX class probable F420-dependent enzyme [Tenggerimyces flavus]